LARRRGTSRLGVASSSPGAVIHRLRAPAHVQAVVVDQVVERLAGVEERLDGVGTVLLDVLADARAVVRHDVHHLAVRRREAQVVLEEIDVREDMRHDELLVDEVVALEQVGVRRVVVDDQLVDLLQAVRIALVELVEVHAEGPVRVATRETAVGGDLVHLLPVDDLEQDVEEVEAVAARHFADLAGQPLQLGSGLAGSRSHRPFPRNSLIES
jgi:hypothetical protein